MDQIVRQAEVVGSEDSSAVAPVAPAVSLADLPWAEIGLDCLRRGVEAAIAENERLGLTPMLDGE